MLCQPQLLLVLHNALVSSGQRDANACLTWMIAFATPSLARSSPEQIAEVTRNQHNAVRMCSLLALT
jgi:hypothetical protein